MLYKVFKLVKKSGCFLIRLIGNLHYLSGNYLTSLLKVLISSKQILVATELRKKHQQTYHKIGNLGVVKLWQNLVQRILMKEMLTKCWHNS